MDRLAGRFHVLAVDLQGHATRSGEDRARDRDRRNYAVAAEVRRPASLAAAVATAAHGVLVARVPGQAAEVGEQYRAYLASIPGSRAKLNGIDLGVQVADAVIALRSSDRFGNAVPYVQPTPGPGVFEPVAPTSSNSDWSRRRSASSPAMKTSP